jgi:hypothetical protein
VRKRNRRVLPSCLPADVLHDEFDFAPTWQERKLVWHRQQIALCLAEAKRLELLEQKAWLIAATQRAVAAALEIDVYKRQAAIDEEIQRTENWWAETTAREQAQTEALMAAYQKQIDGGAYEKMVERSKAAAEDIRKTDARIERMALLKRGVLRGRRNS